MSKIIMDYHPGCLLLDKEVRVQSPVASREATVFIGKFVSSQNPERPLNQSLFMKIVDLISDNSWRGI